MVGGLVEVEAAGTIGTWEGAEGRLGGCPGLGVGGPRGKFPEVALKLCLPPPSVEAVQPGPPMAPYSLPKEDVKWPPTLQPPVVLGPPAPDPSLLGPTPGNPAGFGELLPEVLPSLQPGPLAASLPPTGEQLLPDLLISPHMLPRKDPQEGWVGKAELGGWFARRVEDEEQRCSSQSLLGLGAGWGGNWDC